MTILFGLVLSLMIPVQAAETDVWEFVFTAVLHGPRGALVIMDGAASFDQGRGVATGGGSLLFTDGAGAVSSGHWSILNLLSWRFPDEQLRPGKPELDLDLLVSLPLPDRPASFARISFETSGEEPYGRVTVSLAHPNFPTPGTGRLFLRKRPQ
jgi:hypothetical protein